ncbi:hypothetical protein M0813_23780 [Anaeramoeba flamelloides]|uniref:Uncharacterized protein n=1 Tax=Anaeramoeba flamelloides TaxID=1746091 RepID=A0ABQ8Y789_9EUKA|nr:hypothetical protein M0813_23780 [Anaeramoeba flamelloides]
MSMTGIQLLSLELDSHSTVPRKRIFNETFSKQSGNCKNTQGDEPIMTNQTHFKKKKRQNTRYRTSQLDLPSSLSNPENIQESFQNSTNPTTRQWADRNSITVLPLTSQNNNTLSPTKVQDKDKYTHTNKNTRANNLINRITQNKEHSPKKSQKSLNPITLKMKQKPQSSQTKSLLFYKFKLTFLVDRIIKSTNY